MTKLVIIATEADEACAGAIAEALAVLDLKAVRKPDEAGGADCVVAFWSEEGLADPQMIMQATLAMHHGKLVGVSTGRAGAPDMFKAAPHADLGVRDRAAFQRNAELLIGEMEKRLGLKTKPEGRTDALIKLREAVGAGARRNGLGGARFPAIAALVAAALFVVGAGIGRVIQDFQSQPRLVLRSTAAHADTAAAAIAAHPFGLAPEHLRALSWREAGARIDTSQADAIKRAALSGDAFAQTLACIGHLAGVQGFLPSPAAAQSFCDAAAEQNYPAALHLSWALYRSSPHALVDAETARARLEEAARLGWPAAEVDYALLLAPDHDAALDDQMRAGRLLFAAAERDDARAQFFYARWLRDSPAGPRDPSAAAVYLERAVEHGRADAMHMLATLCRDGVGVARDRERAQELYEAAARQDFAPAMFNLADMVRQTDRARAQALYARLACMRDEVQISALAGQRLRAMGQRVSCG